MPGARCHVPGQRLMTTITSFATAANVTLSELKPEAFLPADAAALVRSAGDATGRHP